MSQDDVLPECQKCFAIVNEEDLDYDHNVCKSCIADWIEEMDEKS